MCGEILLQRYTANIQKWKNISAKHTKPMSAFAYGTAGVHEAIKRLGLVTDDPRFRRFEIATTEANQWSWEKSLEPTKQQAKSEKLSCFMPGLFTGLSGYGYRLLYNYNAQLFPNIFLFE